MTEPITHLPPLGAPSGEYATEAKARSDRTRDRRERRKRSRAKAAEAQKNPKITGA